MASRRRRDGRCRRCLLPLKATALVIPGGTPPGSKSRRGQDLPTFTSSQTRHRAIRSHPVGRSSRPPLRASSTREDPASQDRVGEPRELARPAGSRRAARAGIRRGGVPWLSRVRHPLLRICPRPVHGLRPGVRGGGPAEPGSAAMGTLGVPIGCLAGRGHGWPALPMASPAGARAAVGDLRAEAIARVSRRPTHGRRSPHENLPRRDRADSDHGLRWHC